MRAKITVADENGTVLGQFVIDHTYLHSLRADCQWLTAEMIGDKVIEQLPSGINFLKPKGYQDPGIR